MARRGCVEPRSPAIRKRQNCWAIALSEAVRCRQTIRKRQLVSPRRRSGAPAGATRASFALSHRRRGAQDNGEAARWLRVAAEWRRPSIASGLGQFGGPRSGRPRRLRKDWLDGSWRRPDPAISSLPSIIGVCFVKGLGVERDEQQAAAWLRHAAEGVAGGSIHVRANAGGGPRCGL